MIAEKGAAEHGSGPREPASVASVTTLGLAGLWALTLGIVSCSRKPPLGCAMRDRHVMHIRSGP